MTAAGGPRAVVTGLGVLSPIGADVTGFSAALRAGRGGVTEVPVGPGGYRWAAPLDEADLGPLTGEGELTDRARVLDRRAPMGIRATIRAGLQAWRAAGLTTEPVDPERAGVVVAGSNLAGGEADRLAERFAAEPRWLSPRYALRYQDTDQVGVLSHLFGIRGEGCTVGAASASGNVAVITAARLLELGQLDVCLVVGAPADLSAMQARSFLNLGAMADPPAGGAPAPPFDRGHNGFVYGQAAGLAGYATALDGNSLADPSEDGEVRVMRAALAAAGRSAREVGYVSTHGTGSVLGDEVEAAALRKVFGESGPWANATKSLTGHCLGAAGVVEALATVVQLQDGFVHPDPDRSDPLDTGCRLVTGAARPAEIDVALSNAFGFGGFNTGLVLTRAA